MNTSPSAPAAVTNRVALTHTTIGEWPVAAGQVVIPLLAAANRDPKVYPEPDEFRLRSAERPLTFGFGVHQCLGTALGVAATTELVSQLTRRFSSLTVRETRFSHTIVIRSLERALIVLGAAGAAGDRARPVAR